MRFNFLGKKKNLLFRDFLIGLKNGERDVSKILGIKAGDFEEATFDQLMSNPDDVLAKVNRVQMNFRDVYFGLFNSCLIKHDDFGDVQYIFYTTTNDANMVISMAEDFFSVLGEGFFDSNQSTSLRKHDKIRTLAAGQYSKSNDALMNTWLLENLSIGLHYRVSPLRQLSLHVSIKAPRKEDKSVRKKGTILDLLKLDPVELLKEAPIHKEETLGGGTIKFIDYTYALEPKEFGLFNVIELRIFGDKQEFDKFTQTHITLRTVGPADSDKKIAVAEELYRIYGNDTGNAGELEFYERDKIEAGTYWVGRTWRFNEAHALRDLNNPEEKLSYDITVDNTDEEEAFKLHIFCYNQLVAQFGES